MSDVMQSIVVISDSDNNDGSGSEGVDVSALEILVAAVVTGILTNAVRGLIQRYVCL